MGITRDLAKYCSELKYRQLPEEVIDRVKYFFLDFIGVACRGSQEDSSQTMYRFVKEMESEKPGGVMIGTRERAPFVYAALANGTSSHAIEMDDVNNESSLHPGVVVFPSALATSEMGGTAGKRFIEAVVLGYEVMVRLGKALGPENSYGRGFHPTATCGTFGSSATAEIITKDGKRYFTKVEYPKGDPENPLSWEELIEKFHDLSGRFMTKERRQRIVDQVKNLEKVLDPKKWSSILLRNR